MKSITKTLYRAIAKLYRKILARKIFDMYQGTIQRGPFSGLKYDGKSNISEAAHGLKIFGLYEEPVLSYLLSIPNKNTFIDIGAGDGYYPVGLTFSHAFKRAICFEMTEKGRKAIERNSKLNNVQDLVEIHGAATSNLASELKAMHIPFEKTVLLMDIEGYEFELLSTELLSAIKGAHLIIELHDGPASTDGSRSNLIANLENGGWTTHIIKDRSSDWSAVDSLKEWHDLDRALLFSAGRKLIGEWLIAEPKAKSLS
jgi:precorrin-6B methylase 2